MNTIGGWITAQVSIDNCIKERLARIRTDYNQKCLQSILKQKPRFISIEDLQKRAKVSSTIIDKMKLMGILNDLPDSSQLTLF